MLSFEQFVRVHSHNSNLPVQQANAMTLNVDLDASLQQALFTTDPTAQAVTLVDEGTKR